MSNNDSLDGVHFTEKELQKIKQKLEALPKVLEESVEYNSVVKMPPKKKHKVEIRRVEEDSEWG